MNVISFSTVARNQAVVLIPTAMETSAHSSWPMARRRLRARTILVSTAHSRPSLLTAASKVGVALAPSPTRSTFFAHGEKRDFSSRTRGLAQPDV
jgi:hypothetical protein